MAMLSHRQGWLSAAVLLVFPFVLLAGKANDAPTAPYRIGASEVRVTFFATDQSNRLVETVGRDDFAVVDSRIVVRDFRSLSRSNETTLDVVVLVDTSESVAPRFQAAMHEVVQLISQQAPGSDDNISVVSFAGLQPVLVCARDCRTVAAEDRLHALKAAGVTPLFDALTYAADLAARRQTPGVRPVLIVFSDGNDTISKASARDAMGAAMASGALLYTIDLNDPKHVTEGSAVLQQMAEATGGRAFSLQEGAVQALQAVFADLHASYLVTYQLPSRAVGFHSLRILPKHNLNLRFHCRSGYYYDESSS